MNIDWGAARLFWDIGQALVLVVLSAYAWWGRRNRASESTIRDINHRLDGAEKKIAQVEQAVNSRPDHGDLERLRQEMSETNRLLAEMSASQRATTQLVNRLHDYLLNERGRQ